MLKVRITTVPEGEAPLWVREKWLGVVLEGEEFEPREDAPPVGVLTGESVIRNYKGSFICTFGTAIEALRQVAPDAASWWDTHYFGPALIFTSDWFELVDRGE